MKWVTSQFDLSNNQNQTPTVVCTALSDVDSAHFCGNPYPRERDGGRELFTPSLPPARSTSMQASACVCEMATMEHTSLLPHMSDQISGCSRIVNSLYLALRVLLPYIPGTCGVMCTVAC